VPTFDRSNKPAPQPTPVPTAVAAPPKVQSPRLTNQFRSYRLQTMQPVHSSSPCYTGLRNLGNTCFMNSILQALNATEPLVTYFVQNRFMQELNRSSRMGCKGELAEEFAELIRAMNTQQYRHLSPRMFKDLLSRFAPQFAGSQQQDAQVGMGERGQGRLGERRGQRASCSGRADEKKAPKPAEHLFKKEREGAGVCSGLRCEGWTVCKFL
jgi:hypothetical protein